MANDDEKAKVKEELAKIDINKLTMADIAKMKNPAVREALLEMIRNPQDLAASHQNHGSHGDHSTNASRFLELEMLGRGGLIRGGGGAG